MSLWSSLVPVQEIGAFSLLGEVVLLIVYSLREILNSVLGFLTTRLAQSSGGTIPAWL